MRTMHNLPSELEDGIERFRRDKTKLSNTKKQEIMSIHDRQSLELGT